MLSTKLIRSQIASNLYLFIITLEILSVVLGMNLAILARQLGRNGDPYQTLSLQETGVCVLASGILCLAFATHRMIQRLVKLNNEQEADPPSI